MKNFTFLLVLLICTLSFSSVAQVKRCATDERMAELFRTDPAARLRYENMQRMLDQKLEEMRKNPNLQQRTNAIYTVPVVVHVATANPALVTDAVVQAQLDTLNWYYGNQSANDSLRVYDPFRTTYGRSSIRFCLAQRDPNGLATTGVQRVTTPTTFTFGGAHPSTVVPAWNTQNYMNIWVVTFTDQTLGYAPLPGSYPAGSPLIGFVADYRAFGSGPSYLYSTYNGGKTCVHEVGHFFNLRHTWGNGGANPSCTGTDLCADTPPTAGPHFGCPGSVPVLDACSPAAPGIMWQNHMDYSDDRCMILFTKDQVTRMDAAITTSPDRNTLFNSNGCVPVVSLPNDAGIFSINTPANLSASCAATVIPQITLRNYGTANLTSVNINVTVNGVAQPGYPFTWSGSLSPNSSVNVTLPVLSLVSGTNTIVATTSQPNGVVDANPSNDSKTNTTTRLTAIPLPVSEGFESTTFPPANWSVINPEGDVTWARTTPGRNGSLGKMTMNNFDFDNTGTFDDFRSTTLTVSPAGNYTISFDLAHKNWPNPVNYDTLSVDISADCGVTYVNLYKKQGTTLATAGSSNLVYTTPVAGDWRTESIVVTGGILSSGQIIVRFRNSGRFGNNIHIDNINIASTGGRDLRMVSINSPATNSCSPNVTPSVTIANEGTETITAFKVGYRLNTGANTITTFNQSIAPGATTTVSLPVSIAPTGNNSITAFTADPVAASGTGDLKTSNDTLSKAFVIPTLLSLPIVEGFETAFPPAGWTILNPNNNITWVRKAPGRASAFSAFFDNYNNNVVGQIDEMRIPVANIAGADSVLISFDLAHKQYVDAGGAANDRLTVLSTSDCGNTYNTVYNKAGTALATAGTSDADYVSPGAGDWRRETISLGGAAIASGSIGVTFRNTNDWGNNVFIDNINISGLFKRDLQLVSINAPTPLICSNNITPAVTVRNVGSETVTAFKVSYSINGGAPQTQNITGVSVARNAQVNVTLPATTVAGPGGYTLRVYSWDPVTASGTGDLNRSNDTLTRAFSVPGNVAAPLTETFVSATFPPANWSVLNPDGGTTWVRSNVGSTTPGSAVVNTFGYTTLGQKDDLATPIISFPSSDSVRLQFDVSAVTRTYPGITNTPIDTLEVLVTKDCGNTFTSVYKKWGNQLQTINDPNFPQTVAFTPTSSNQWRRETVDLTQFGNQSPLQLMFRVTNNFENNIYIDNVNFFAFDVPTLLKQQGYLVYPTAFRNSFEVRHYQTPANLKFISVFNSLGQMVWTKQYNGNASTQMSVDLTGRAAGVYFVEIGYTDANRNVTQKITKY